MTLKANNHPLVRDLRRILDRHGLDAAVIVGISKTGNPIAVSAGSDVAKCDAVGPILESEAIDMLKFDIDHALVTMNQMDLFEEAQ